MNWAMVTRVGLWTLAVEAGLLGLCMWLAVLLTGHRCAALVMIAVMLVAVAIVGLVAGAAVGWGG